MKNYTAPAYFLKNIITLAKNNIINGNFTISDKKADLKIENS